jgi:hypothetical protein
MSNNNLLGFSKGRIWSLAALVIVATAFIIFSKHVAIYHWYLLKKVERAKTPEVRVQAVADILIYLKDQNVLDNISMQNATQNLGVEIKLVHFPAPPFAQKTTFILMVHVEGANQIIELYFNINTQTLRGWRIYPVEKETILY